MSIRALLSVFMMSLAVSAQSADPQVALPEDYRTTFTNYLSLDRVQNPDQTIRLFANDIAMQGPGEDGKLPYGSVIVAEVYKAKKDAEGNVITSELNRRIRDKMALIAVMQREEGWGEQHPEGIRNGNWEMAAYTPDGSDAGKDINACMACHAPLVDRNFVFSYSHLKK